MTQYIIIFGNLYAFVLREKHLNFFFEIKDLGHTFPETEYLAMKCEHRSESRL